MYLALILWVLASQASLVMPHGGHVDDPVTQPSSSLNNALLSYLCRGDNGVMCNGHGTCERGICLCSSGYRGVKCDMVDGESNTIKEAITESPAQNGNDVSGLNLHDLLGIVATNDTMSVSCSEADELPCGGHGMCHDGICACDEGFSGLTCELSHSVGFCRTYKECAECMSLMGKCPEKCTKIAHFKLVFGFPIALHGASFRKCRFTNSERNCTFYFKEEGENEFGVKIIMVKACLPYQDASVSNSNVVEQITDRPVTPDMTSQDVDVEPGDDGTQDKQGGGSGQEMLTMNLLTILSSLAMLKL